jgi:aryl-alcohol dehydrogenase-like predicted oxidoreductase
LRTTEWQRPSLPVPWSKRSSRAGNVILEIGSGYGYQKALLTRVAAFIRRLLVPPRATTALMRERELGQTGERVSAVGLGCMRLSLAHRPPEHEAVALIRRALDLGVTLLDSADGYALDERERGHNERLIAKALAGRRDEVLVATKGGVARPAGRWVIDASPARLRAACEESLRALGSDRIDLYQLHAPDPRVPFEDSVGTLAELRRAGKIRLLGLSNVTRTQIEVAMRITEIVSVQNELSVLVRAAEQDGTVALCAERRLTFLAYRPLAGRQGAMRLGEIPALAAAAERLQETPARVALAWLLARWPHVIPLPGPTRITTLEEAVRAAELVLTEGDAEAIAAGAS